jgi:hypothetical protein
MTIPIITNIKFKVEFPGEIIGHWEISVELLMR